MGSAGCMGRSDNGLKHTETMMGSSTNWGMGGAREIGHFFIDQLWEAQRGEAQSTDRIAPQSVVLLWQSHSSKVVISSTLKKDGSLDNSDHSTVVRQLWPLASFSPEVVNIPISSSDTPRNSKNSRVNMGLSAVIEMSIAADILDGDRNLYAIF